MRIRNDRNLPMRVAREGLRSARRVLRVAVESEDSKTRGDTDRVRIAVLEAKCDDLERRVAALERGP